MWKRHRDRPDDPAPEELETARLARDEYERPRYDGPVGEDARVGAERGHSRRSRSPHVGDSPEQGFGDLRVHELMTRKVASVHPETSVTRAARMMEECDCGALPVVTDNGTLVGMVTDRDIALGIVARGRDVHDAIVADCMTERVVACYADETIAECLRHMAERQVRRMPVVDDRGRLVGIVSQSDLARHAGEHAIAEGREALTDVLRAVSRPGNGR